MSSIAERAIQELVDARAIDDFELLGPTGELGDLAFACSLPIPIPNSEGLPESARFRVRIPVQFPHAEVELGPIEKTVRGFPHQDGRTGALCLKPTAYPRDPAARLQAYLDGAQEWLADAARGTLLEPGQRWELPDFRTTTEHEAREVLHLESADTFAVWSDRVGQSGDVQFAAHVHDRGIVPVRFTLGSDRDYKPTVNEGFLNRRISHLGAWMLLPSFVVERHRPARTFRELEEQCAAAGLDLWRIVHRAVKHQAHRGFHYLLVGAPIPKRVGAPADRIHWQPIALAEASVRSMRGGGKKRRPCAPSVDRALRSRLQGTLRHRGVPWSSTTAYTQERAEARGSLAPQMKELRICVLGCGALGSLVAEHLARGGVRDLTLFDSEALELENLSRHTLSPVAVGSSKAVALASRLNGIHPTSHIRGYALHLPPTPKPRRRDRLPWNLLTGADVLIDCTADDNVLQWASKLGREHGKLVVHLFLNAHARMLTLCVSGRHASCAKVTQELLQDISAGRTGFTTEEHDPNVEELFPGAGCWHATFPALGANIATLAGAAIPALERIVSRPRASSGAALVFRRRELDLDHLPIASPAPVVEIAWAAEYR